jgi:ABC-type molybdate transport system substrate-binding protein
MYVNRLAVGLAFLGASIVCGGAAAAELKVLSVEAMRPALQELVPAFEAASKNKLKVDYGTADTIEKKIDGDEEYDVVILDRPITTKLIGKAKLAGGLVKGLAKPQGGDLVYDASTTNFCQEPLAAKALVDFLAEPKAVEVYKTKGLQPG